MSNVLKLQKHLAHIAAAINIYSFASALAGVFIPLVILQSGGRLWQISVFYMFYASIKLAINYPAMLFIRGHGARAGLGFAFLGGALQMLSMLGFAATKHWLLLGVGALAMAFTNAFLWNSQHLFISRAMDDSTKSSSLATITIIGQLSSVVAPLVGGFIGLFFGPGWLLAVAVVLCAVALGPLRKLGGQPETINEPIAYTLRGAPSRDVLANFFFNIETAVGVMVWPIYLAVFARTYQAVGAITAIAAAVAVVVTWLAGHRGDKGKDRAVLKEGVVVSSVVDIVRIFVTSQAGIAVVGSVYKASLAYFQNAWASTYYHHAKRRGMQYIMSMEIACDIAYFVLWGALLTVLLFSTVWAFFAAAFIIAAVSAWGCLFITKQGELMGSN